MAFSATAAGKPAPNVSPPEPPSNPDGGPSVAPLLPPPAHPIGRSKSAPKTAKTTAEIRPVSSRVRMDNTFRLEVRGRALGCRPLASGTVERGISNMTTIFICQLTDETGFHIHLERDARSDHV